MKYERVFTGSIEEGDSGKRLVLDDREAMVRHVERYFGAGEEVEVVIRKKRRRRSLNQNAYWWGIVLRVAADELGYADPDDLHDALCFKFRPLPPDELTGAPRRARTSEMSSEEFSAFTTDVITWLEADMNIRVQRPGELDSVA